jgi:hypothetical protein
VTLRGGGLLLVIAAPLAAQSLEGRIATAPDGVVRLAYTARPGVCSEGRDATRVRECGCEPGPVRLSLQVRSGRVITLRVRVGGPWPVATGATTDLGTVPAAEAARFLLALAARDSGQGGEHAVFPATLADSITVWPTLLQLARDARVVRRTRRQAVFWLGQAAGAEATRGLDSLASDEHQDSDVRGAAVFALSQRPRDEGVPLLVRIARNNRDPGLRRKAIFWLGQSDDPRALALFEELLTRP